MQLVGIGDAFQVAFERRPQVAVEPAGSGPFFARPRLRIAPSLDPLAERGAVAVAPLVDFVLTWNTGISYGWFQQEGPLGQWALLVIKALAVALLWIWLSRASSRPTALALGLIVGGAIGNAIDRIAYGAVADFFSLHAFGYQWYVFNIADMAIVAGVVGLLYDSLFRGHKKVGNPSKM